MRIGVPKEIKTLEFRVGCTPAGVAGLAAMGHEVWVEAGAGTGSGFSDDEYARSGARVVAEAAEVWQRAELVVKVKEPIASEFAYFRADLTIFTYLHLAAAPELLAALLEHKVTAIAYETVERDGALPLLTPMSAIAGRLAVQAGARYLEKANGGKGILLAGMPGVPRGHVVILGGGVVGSNAAKIAVGMGARVTVLDVNTAVLGHLEESYRGQLETLYSDATHLSRAVASADVVVGGVLLPGAKAPKLVTSAMVATMQPGSVIVDVAIDQGGCVETSRPTSHAEPTYGVHGVTHYCVTNMPGAVPRTSTLALTNATLPYVHKLARLGPEAALAAEPGLGAGLNVARGEIRHPALRA